MIEFSIYEARTFYSGPEQELEKMYECLRVKDKSAYFRARLILRKMGFYGRPDENATEEEKAKYEKIVEQSKWIKFYDKRSRSFGSGLLRTVKDHLRNSGIDYISTDHRNKRPKFGDADVRYAFERSVEARSEQREAFRTALFKGSGILHLATNAGKTEIAAMIISAWSLKMGRMPRTLFLIHRKGLAEQTKQRFEKHLGVEVARIGGGQRKLHRITVATTQTAASLIDSHSAAFLEYLSKCDLVFVDELHINKAKQVIKVLNHCRARMRFGLSGTISKDPAKMMRYIGTIGPVISEVRNKELVEKGRSAKPKIRMVRVETDEVDGSFGESYRNAIVNNRYRNKKVVKEAFRYVDKDYRTLITVARIKHGKLLRDRIQRKSDVPVEYMDGSTPLQVRERYKKQFAKGKLPILIASPIFDVGEDLPEIDAWVNAAGGKGWELVLQRLGRTLRKKEGENRVRITDFLDQHNDYMLKHSLARLKYYIDEEIADIKIIR